MSKAKVRVVTVMAVLLVVFSVIVFVLPFKKNSVFWLSYLFGILALAVQLYILKGRTYLPDGKNGYHCGFAGNV